MVEMEVKGIPFTCDKHGIDPASLGVTDCTLYYRRRKQDMPLASIDNPTPAQQAKLEISRAKILDKVIRKFLVKFEERCLPVRAIEEGGRLAGLVFRRTEIEDGRAVELPGTDFEVRAPDVVASIGSVPQVIEGVPTKGELYKWRSWDTGELEGYEGVYGLGNVLTGKGNIKASRTNARLIAEHIMKSYLGLDGARDEAAMSEVVHAAARAKAEPVVEEALATRPELTREQIERIFARVRERWKAVGYDGNYREWIDRVTPEDMQ
jgi:hypothetical protein